MRKIRDGEATKETVIAEAKKVFAKNGFKGTSLALISENCGISDGLILHHFKSKKNLYHVILADLAREYADRISRAGENAENPEQAALAMLRAVIEFWGEDMVYARMSLWAYLENQTELIDEEVKLTASLAATIQHLQAQGKVNAYFSPFVLLSMTIGTIHFWKSHQGLFQEALHRDNVMEELNKTFLEQYLRLIQKVYQTGADE